MNERLKILIIGPGYPFRNGQSVFLAHLCQKLSDKFNVELVNYTLLYPGFLFPGSSQFDSSKERKLRFPNKRMLSSINPLTWIRTARYIKKQDPDLIAIDWWHPFFGMSAMGMTFLLPSRLKKRLFFITENVISHEANRIDLLLTRIGLKHAQCFLALSLSVEEHLKRLFNKKVFRSALPIYDFYEDQIVIAGVKEQMGYKEEHIVFLFFGLIRHYKGLDILIDAFARVRAAVPEARLLVAGEFYEPDGPYMQKIQDNNLGDVVTVENRYIPDNEVSPFFKACDCVVMPYRSATQSGILSMAYGFKKPAIVTAVGELAAMVEEGETGYVTQPEDIVDLSDKMILFCKQRQSKDFTNNISRYLKKNNEFESINDTIAEIHQYLSIRSSGNKG